MGDITTSNGNLIAKEGHNIKDFEFQDKKMGKVKISVSKHKEGGRAYVCVESEFTSETRMPLSGDNVVINGVMINHH